MQPRRPTCPTCLRPQTACLCAHVRTVKVATEILILQHPLEEHQAKNSARLLHLCLGARSRIVVGESFEQGELRALLHEGAAPLLLYPGAPDDAAATGKDGGPRRLVVLDATWRKSRKMLALNPVLAELPRLSLPDDGAGLYAIRKAHAAHQRSTLEATARALMLLEPAAPVAPLFDAMRGFVAQQQSFVPDEL